MNTNNNTNNDDDDYKWNIQLLKFTFSDLKPGPVSPSRRSTHVDQELNMKCADLLPSIQFSLFFRQLIELRA